MKVAVLGAGAWGTALALSAARRHEVLLWARDAPQAEVMQRERCNARYLPGVAWPLALTATAELALALQPEDARVLWLCKGFEAGTAMLGHQIAEAVAPGANAGVLSGPSFAQEVAAGLPTALVAASFDAALAEMAVDVFHGGALRIYTSADPVGVEVGGAVKNVLAIATGIADGLSLGLNARAALITRGLAEMSRLGLAMGARLDTFMGLAGLGDLVLTATGDLSRNRRVGLMLAEGLALDTILARLGHVAEGVYSAATVVQRAAALQVEMPLAQTVQAVLAGRITAAQAVERLMQRGARAES